MIPIIITQVDVICIHFISYNTTPCVLGLEWFLNWWITTCTYKVHVHGLTLSDVMDSFNIHYNDVIMGAMASQITSLTIVHSTVYSGADQRKHQSSASLANCAGNSTVTGEFPAQMASNAENVSIWWRHHGWHDATVQTKISIFTTFKTMNYKDNGWYFADENSRYILSFWKLSYFT